MEERYYFAYGSNMNLEQMKYRCPAAEVVENVRLENYRLAFRGRAPGNGVATVLPEKGWSKSSLNTSKRECSSERQTYERTRRTDVYNYCNRSSWHLVSRQNKKVSSEGMSATAGLLRLAD